MFFGEGEFKQQKFLKTEVCFLFLWVSGVEMKVGSRVGCGFTLWISVGWGWRVDAVDGSVGAAREVKRRVGVGWAVG